MSARYNLLLNVVEVVTLALTFLSLCFGEGFYTFALACLWLSVRSLPRLQH